MVGKQCADPVDRRCLFDPQPEVKVAHRNAAGPLNARSRWAVRRAGRGRAGLTLLERLTPSLGAGRGLSPRSLIHEEVRERSELQARVGARRWALVDPGNDRRRKAGQVGHHALVDRQDVGRRRDAV
eukprot:11171728-Alexandrium_andersonii.AAC.1